MKSGMNVHIEITEDPNEFSILCKILDSLFESLCEHSDGYFREIGRVILNMDNYDFRFIKIIVFLREWKLVTLFVFYLIKT